jgi:sigma-B regulation protein RsbU (phosphoserine phosphatase)
MKILIVDDDSTTRLVLGATLDRLGHEVIAAADGASAWKILQEQTISILFTDWNMPGMSGLDLCRHVRSAPGAKYTYIILLTVLDGRDYFLKGMEAGADDFIAKPWDDQQLAARLRVAERLVQLQSEVTVLSGLLPICSYCKSIRDDHNYWQQLEGYLSTRTDARFSHGICPKCYKEHIIPQFEKLGMPPPLFPGVSQDDGASGSKPARDL